MKQRQDCVKEDRLVCVFEADLIIELVVLVWLGFESSYVVVDLCCLFYFDVFLDSFIMFFNVCKCCWRSS